MLSNAHKELVSRNTQVIKSPLKCVAFCGEQGLLFKVTYLETAPRNALCISKTIQNGISIIGGAIQDSIIEEIHTAKFLPS